MQADRQVRYHGYRLVRLRRLSFFISINVRKNLQTYQLKPYVKIIIYFREKFNRCSKLKKEQYE